MTRAPAAAAPPVLLITGEYPPTVGGVGDYTATLASHLRAVGTPACVLTGQSAALPDENTVYRTIPTWGLRGWSAVGAAIAATAPSLLHLQYQAGAFAGRTAIHLLPWWLARRPRRRPLPIVVTFHDLCVPYLFPKAGPLRQRALQVLARGSAAVIATNGEDWQQLHADKRIQQRLHLIPIGSNIPPLPEEQRQAARAALRARLGLSANARLVAYFGLVSASKGVETLLDALAHAHSLGQREYHLLLIGGEASTTDQAKFAIGGDLAGAIRQRGLTEQVTITGAVPEQQVAAHLAAADCAVLPYQDGASWRRGSLLATLAAGVPLVTTTPAAGYDAAGALPRLSDGDAALLVAPGDAQAIARALDRLATDIALSTLLAMGAKTVVQAFSWEMIAAAHLDLYRTVLTRNESPS